MSVYIYRAVDKQGRKHKGVVEADNVRLLRQHFRSKGLIPLSVRKSATLANFLPGLQKTRTTFSRSSITQFTRELAILLEGGVQLEKALQLLAMQASNPRQRDIILALRTQITEGSSFSASLSTYPDDFDALYRATIASGERIGDTIGVLNKIAEHGETHLRMLSKVKLAMLYPIILATFAIIVVLGMMIYIFPDITKTFVQSGQTLPWLTVALMKLSDWLRSYGFLLLPLLIAVSFAVRWAYNNPQHRLTIDKTILEVPLLRRIVTAMNLARFTATLSMLRNSGVPLTESLTIASEVLDNRWLKRVAEQAAQRVTEGSSLNQSLSRAGYFPPAFINMVESGEASGELDHILELSARNQTRELEKQMLFAVAFLEPVIILSLGLMVLLIVLAIMMPILSMNQLVK